MTGTLDDSGAGETSRQHHRLIDKRQAHDELQHRRLSLSRSIISAVDTVSEMSNCYS